MNPSATALHSNGYPVAAAGESGRGSSIAAMGSMKSGKTGWLVATMAPLQHSKIPYLNIKPLREKRDQGIESRLGSSLPDAVPVSSIAEVVEMHHRRPFQYLGWDETHFFNTPEDAAGIDALLRLGVHIRGAGLDMDYRGTLMNMYRWMLQMPFDSIMHKVAVCEFCQDYSGVYTQILFKEGARDVPLGLSVVEKTLRIKESEPQERIIVVDGLDQVVPEDGTLEYRAACRDCFTRHPKYAPF